jgi:hypothetical protein
MYRDDIGWEERKSRTDCVDRLAIALIEARDA